MMRRRRRDSPFMTRSPYEGSSLRLVEVGGTSAGAPQWSALLAIADQGRASSDQTPLDGTSPQQVMDDPVPNTGDFHDITSGTSTGTPHYSAGPGYDYVTGLGTPMANLVVGSLVRLVDPTHDNLILTASLAETAGTFVQPHGHRGKHERGDGHGLCRHDRMKQFRCPGRVARELHLHRPPTTGRTRSRSRSKTAGSQSITATDTANVGRHRDTFRDQRQRGGREPLRVVWRSAPTTTAGVSQTLTVTAEDPYGNVATGIRGHC